MKGDWEVLLVGALPEDVVAAIEAPEYGVVAGLSTAYPGGI